MEENLCMYISEKGLITRMYRELKKLNSPNINDPMKNQANEITFSKKKSKWPKNT
jgi:hypothetical protein